MTGPARRALVALAWAEFERYRATHPGATPDDWSAHIEREQAAIMARAGLTTSPRRDIR